MNLKLIDMRADARYPQYQYFRDMAYPYAGLTVNVEIGEFMRRRAQVQAPFFLSFLYAATNAVNDVKELRRRLCGTEVVEFENCPVSYTLALDNGTYGYCALDCAMPFARFLPYAQDMQAKALKNPSLDDGADALSLIFVSTVPWLSYTALIQPTPSPADSNPRVTWGKYTPHANGVTMPVTILCHHALADGVHIAKFYEALDARLRAFPEG